MMEATVKIEMCVELHNGETLNDFKPNKQHPSDAAYDLFSASDYINESSVSSGAPQYYYDLAPGERKLFPAGFKMELPEGWEAQIRPRSGNALNKGITVLNTPGTIDSAYRGEVGVILYNSSSSSVRIWRRDKIAQMVIQRVPEVQLEFVSSINKNTDRGAKGFGSSGIVGE